MTAQTSHKSPDALRTISEAADDLGVAQHVLRFWEDKFSQLRPMKRAGGRRYYRPEDLNMLRRIQSLLRDEGYTIKGVQKLMKMQSKAEFLQPAAANNSQASQQAAAAQTMAIINKPQNNFDGQERQILESALADLKTLRSKLTTRA